MTYAVYGKDRIIKALFAHAETACRYADQLGVSPVSENAQSGQHLYAIPLSQSDIWTHHNPE